MKQPLKRFLNPHKNNYFINVYPQTKTYNVVNTDEHVTGALTLEAQAVDAGMVMIHDCGDTKRHLKSILPKDVKSNPKAFMNEFKSNYPSLYRNMKSLYRVSLGPDGFFVIVTPNEMKTDNHGKRIAYLTRFIEELYFIHDYKGITN